MKNKKQNPDFTEKTSSRNPEDETQKEKSNHAKRSGKDGDEEFPGYPHYPASDDIFNSKSEMLPLPEEKATQGEKKNPQPPDNKILNEAPVEKSLFDEDDETRPKSEADVTPEEIELLDSDNLNTDMGDDEQLRKRVTPVDMSGSDLDVPGSELDDADEEIGEEDEENNSFSIGGDRHEDLEEPRL